MFLRNKAISLLVTTFILFSDATLSATSPASFSAEQEAQIGKIAGDYLLAHPEILVQVSQKLQEQQYKRMQMRFAMKVMEHQRELLNDPDTPSSGPDGAGIAVIEFFDYQCIHCAHFAPVMEQVMNAHPEVRFVFKEWPIFAEKWPVSERAAIRGLDIWKKEGAVAYMTYHNGIYRTGNNEGKLTDADIDVVSKAAGFRDAAFPDQSHLLTKTDELANNLGLTGTPGLIVMPVQNPTPDTITVFPERVSAEQLRSAIEKAMRGKR
uniref:DsbA family protein n=1 Tax=Enterobacter sp. TaxID=42895 RepID=UPI00296F8493|nr:thioredoxin domain-containing protein [Enterobacter sp.]